MWTRTVRTVTTNNITGEVAEDEEPPNLSLRVVVVGGELALAGSCPCPACRAGSRYCTNLIDSACARAYTHKHTQVVKAFNKKPKAQPFALLTGRGRVPAFDDEPEEHVRCMAKLFRCIPFFSAEKVGEYLGCPKDSNKCVSACVCVSE